MKKLDKKQFGHIKCDCGHYRKDHYLGGWCQKCACTWWWPNIKYIQRYQKKKNESNK